MKITRRRHLLPGLLLLLLPAWATAQFTFTTNNGALTVKGYTGTGGHVFIPSITNGLPVTTIGTSAFAFNDNITGVSIPNTVTNVGLAAFTECNGLKSLTIPDSVISIGNSAFLKCFGLTNVTVGDGVTDVGAYAFDACITLLQAVIGNAVTNIGNYAFSNCHVLRAVYFRGNAPTAGLGAFKNLVTTNYYLPSRTGWGTTLGGGPTALWKPRVLPRDQSFGIRTNQFGFNVNWTRGMTVAVDACTNLVNPDWMPLQTNTLAADTQYLAMHCGRTIPLDTTVCVGRDGLTEVNCGRDARSDRGRRDADPTTEGKRVNDTILADRQVSATWAGKKLAAL